MIPLNKPVAPVGPTILMPIPVSPFRPISESTILIIPIMFCVIADL